jgi:hypothetical protein
MKKLILFSVALLVSLASLQAEVTVKIVDPVADQAVEPCVDKVIKAQVTATAGEEIKYVYLYYNDRTLRRLKAEPWEYTMKAIKKGVYVFHAKVELADGTEYLSEKVKVKVGNVHGGELLLSGGFDCAVLSPWTGQLNEGAVATFNVFDDGYFDDPTYLAVEIENGGSAEWHIQLNQSCPTDSGHLYTISFLADSDEPKTIVVGMQENQDPWTNQIWQSVPIDGADLYTVEFEATRTDPTNVLRFNVGGNSIPFYLDDVSVIDNSATSIKSRNYDKSNLVAEYELFQAYPNPFNMNTTIRFDLSHAANVRLDIFNMSGQKVRTLVDESKSAGLHSIGWNGTNEFGAIVPSGVYLYTLHVNAGDAPTTLSRKVLLMK